MSAALVHVVTTDGVATVTMDSPRNRNALSARLRQDLFEALTSVIADPAVHVVVLTHTGSVFCAGMDLKESLGSGRDDQGVNEFPRILELIWNSPKPVIARLAGPARAGGVGLVAACDVAIAADSCTFAFTEVRLGVVPAVISVTVLPRMSARAAAELFLTGETFDARAAADIGLISRAVPEAGLDAEVTRYVEMLRKGAPGALAATKQLVRRDRPQDMAEDFARMAQLSAAAFAGPEGQEGLRAVSEGRPPAWALPQSAPVEPRTA